MTGESRLADLQGVDTAAQVAALKTAGCERIFREKASGGRLERSEQNEMMERSGFHINSTIKPSAAIAPNNTAFWMSH
jgi:hypothetical protein